MDIRPQDLPELRAELVACNESPFGIEWWSRRNFPPASYVVEEAGTVLVVDPTPEERRQCETRRLASAELFFASSEMTELAEAAAASLPEFKIEEADLPAQNGFMVFGQPLSDILVLDDEMEAHIQAVSWSLSWNDELGASLWLSFYSNLHHSWADLQAKYGLPDNPGWPKWIYEFDSEWSFRSDLGQEPPGYTPLSIWGRTVLSAWLLMQQSLAELSDVQADRAARKRLRRIGQEPASVRVIELRRPKHTSGEPGESGRNYTHRWITRGHWRQQWYPARQVHRPVWIAPHVKGPEGAPMIGGEKVYAWKR